MSSHSESDDSEPGTPAPAGPDMIKERGARRGQSRRGALQQGRGQQESLAQACEGAKDARITENSRGAKADMPHPDGGRTARLGDDRGWVGGAARAHRARGLSQASQ